MSNASGVPSSSAVLRFQEYIASDTWVCPASNTQYWAEAVGSGGGGGGGSDPNIGLGADGTDGATCSFGALAVAAGGSKGLKGNNGAQTANATVGYQLGQIGEGWPNGVAAAAQVVIGGGAGGAGYNGFGHGGRGGDSTSNNSGTQLNGGNGGNSGAVAISNGTVSVNQAITIGAAGTGGAPGGGAGTGQNGAKGVVRVWWIQ